MRIGIVGGLDRVARDLEAVAHDGGHELDTHTGVVAGRAAADSLRALVAWSDVVFVLTEINSHNGVKIARQAARAHQRPLRILRRLAPKHLSAYLDGLTAAAGSSSRAA